MEEISEPYLHINEPFTIDESVVEYNYHEYYPIVGTNLNNVNAEIRLVIENQDLFTHPSQSYLFVTGQLQKADGTNYTDADNVALVNNAIPFLFGSIRYQIADKTIDEVNYPGFSSTIKGLISYSNADQPVLMNRGWIMDKTFANEADPARDKGFAARHESVIKKPTPKGSFNFLIPLSHLLGFFEDYQKILYGTKQVLVLMRTQDNDAIFGNAAAALGKIVLKQLCWVMPHVTPSDLQKHRLFELVDRGIQVPIAFRHCHLDMNELPANATSHVWRLITTSALEKPRWIIIAFQTDRSNNQKKNTAVFDHLNLADAHVTLNSERYPFLDLNLNYNEGKFAKLFEMALHFKEKYYDKRDLMFNVTAFKDDYPFVVIDCTKQSERLKTAIIDIQIKLKFKEAIPNNTKCYAIVISDRLMKLQLDRNKMEIIY